MASIGNDKGGRKRVLFVAPDGRRKTIRLGKVSKRIAETAKFHIEGLLTAKLAGHSPDPETAKWLDGTGDVLYKRLSKVGLVSPRSSQSSVMLGDFLNSYIDSRTDIKPQTKKNLQQCVNRIKAFLAPTSHYCRSLKVMPTLTNCGLKNRIWPRQRYLCRSRQRINFSKLHFESIT